MKLAILATHPVQYVAPIFRELARFSDLEFKVFFGCDHGTKPQEDPNFGVVFKWDCDPTTGYDHEFLSSGSIQSIRGLSVGKLTFLALRKISEYKPDKVLIFAYSPLFIALSTILLSLSGKSLLLRAETTDEALSRSIWKDKLRKLLLSSYYRQFDFFFPIGTNSKKHYLRMGVPEEKMTVLPYSIDVDFFQKQVDYWRPQREILRKDVGIEPTDLVLIYCGKMFPPKNPLLLPKALHLLSCEEKSRLWFIAVGEGKLRSQFESQMKAELGDRALFVGFKNQSELGEFYAMADVLVLPSQNGETWGLVVNEALQFGLKVIASDKVGSSRDLIQTENQGYTFPSGQVEAFAKAILASIQDKPIQIEAINLPHPSNLARAIYSQLTIV